MSIQVCGQGIEFDLLCEYVWGDDVCLIDWCVMVCVGIIMLWMWCLECDCYVVIIFDIGCMVVVCVGDGMWFDVVFEVFLLFVVLVLCVGDYVYLLMYDCVVWVWVFGVEGMVFLLVMMDVMVFVYVCFVDIDWYGVFVVVCMFIMCLFLIVVLIVQDVVELVCGFFGVFLNVIWVIIVFVGFVIDDGIVELVC